jgi:hypothetical protein
MQHSSDLESIFGRWPSFHDAEVIRVTLDRSGADGPKMEVVIHVFEATKEVDSRGYFVSKNHIDVTLTFTKVDLVRLDGFNHQNVISCLSIEKVNPLQHDGKSCHVEIPSIYGVDTELYCDRVIVSNIQEHILN